MIRKAQIRYKPTYFLIASLTYGVLTYVSIFMCLGIPNDTVAFLLIPISSMVTLIPADIIAKRLTNRIVGKERKSAIGSRLVQLEEVENNGTVEIASKVRHQSGVGSQYVLLAGPTIITMGSQIALYHLGQQLEARAPLYRTTPSPFSGGLIAAEVGEFPAFDQRGFWTAQREGAEMGFSVLRPSLNRELQNQSVWSYSLPVPSEVKPDRRLTLSEPDESRDEEAN